MSSSYVFWGVSIESLEDFQGCLSQGLLYVTLKHYKNSDFFKHFEPFKEPKGTLLSEPCVSCFNLPVSEAKPHGIHMNAIFT